MNDLCNTQDVILVCKIIENRFQLMNDSYGFNPRKCNSASSLSGLSKFIIALPTSNEIVEVFEKTVTGDFSCVNTRLSFDSEILLPHTNKMQFDGLDNDYKVCYKLKLDNGEGYETKRVFSKIFKLDENNQYGFAIRKPRSTGCMKKEKMPPGENSIFCSKQSIMTTL